MGGRRGGGRAGDWYPNELDANPTAELAMKRKRALRLIGYGMIALALLGTLGMNLFTLVRIAAARTSVPWWDQWVVVQELAQHARGAPLWPTLWSSYWGHRMVIPRLLFLADARWLRLGSLTWLTLLLQFVHSALLMALAWRLLGRRRPALFLVATAAILNLMLSPLQMQNFVWGMQTMFPLVFVAATGAFLSLALAGETGGGWFLAASAACGIVSSYTMPNGILVWPVLVLQAIYLRRNWRVMAAFAFFGAVAIVSYLRHYTRPLEFGMGVGGMLRHPIDAIGLLGCIPGSAFGFSLPVDALIGVAVLAVTGMVLVRALWTPLRERRWLSALASIIVFSLLGSLSLVAGRLSPQVHPRRVERLPGGPVLHPDLRVLGGHRAAGAAHHREAASRGLGGSVAVESSSRG